jgi:two-component system NtrC family sensor kinase
MTAQGFKPGFRAIVAGLATVAAITLGWFNLYQHRHFHPLYDGVTWEDTEHGVVAQDVVKDGPGARAGIQTGDMLISINGEDMKSTQQVARTLDRFHDWQDAKYTLSREGQTFAPNKLIIEPEPPNSLLPYLRVVGLLYLGVGLFVVLRRPNAPRSGHFYVFCLASFALYFCHYTGKFNFFDWTIYWLNVMAWLVQPPLFLHFALVFPKPKPFLQRYRLALPLMYLPGALLLVTHVAIAIEVIRVHLPASAVRWGLDRLELLHMGVMYLAAAAVLHHTYRKADTVVLRQQMKWVTRGTTVAILPFVCVYVLQYVLGQVPSPALNVFVLALALIPITFGYAIFRWRLMDVDILFRRGIVYTLATAVLVALYFTVTALAAVLLRAVLPESGTWGWIIAVVATAFLFQPLRDRIQERLDRFFYSESYDYRRTLIEFGRDISADVDLDRLLDRALDRLSRTLGVNCVAVFLVNEEGEASGGTVVRLERSLGLSFHSSLDLSFLDPKAPHPARGALFFENVHQAVTQTPSAQRTIQELELHYYVPCQAQGRVVGYLGLGKTRDGDFLSTEDVALIETLSGYLGTAIENARLYRRLERKVAQYERLKEYSENIVESVNVGILALDLEDRIESWNTQVELMYGVNRERAIGCRIDEVFPPDLVAELMRLRSTENPTGIHNLYKYRVKTSAGAERVFNVAVAPLVAKDFEMVGRLVIFDDITERVDLERQVTHADKLSSIGLLAAGVAHEVNTPLAVISSYAQMLSKQMPEDDPRWKLLERINRSTFRASEIVNNLLNFSRTGSAEFADVDLNQVIGDTLALLEHQFKTGRVIVDRKAYQPGSVQERLMVHGNSGKLQQVFLNLFLNAREAMPDGGKLTVSAEARDARVYVKVADTGQGIDPRYVERIYDPFFTTKPPKGKVRTDAQKTRDGEAFRGGTGLGLSVTYGIVQEHAGKIAVESTPSQGTIFTLEFPLSQLRGLEKIETRPDAQLVSRGQQS